MSNPIRSREHLLHMLAEASELEHNLLCSYLYAAFSLKQDASEDLLPHELQAVRRWHQAIMGVCMEEMGHLAQVANLMVAVGSRPHFDRPNLPVAPGYHPARIQVTLAPFDLETLEHFIFLERPDGFPIEDAKSFRPTETYERHPEVGVLMPSAPDYETIGEFYQLLTDGLAQLARSLGEEALFIGPADCQLRGHEIGFPELSVVTNLEAATRGLRLIIVQGEGAPAHSETSHFEQFLAIRREYRELLAQRPAFCPHRPVARNPAMRCPVSDGRIHVTGSAAAPVLDAANAVYSLMLRCLVEVYETSWQRAGRREALLGGALGLMKVLAKLSGVLTTLPASDATPSVHAGVTFAMLRSTEGLAPGVDACAILLQRLDRIGRQLPQLGLDREVARGIAETLEALRAGLSR